MRKHDLVQLHGLLDRVRIAMQARDDLSEEALGPYERLDVSPTAIHRPKREHQRAVETLASILSGVESDQPSISPDGTRKIT